MAVAGTYGTTIQTPMGPQKSKLVLNTDGDVLTGTSEGQMGVDEIQDGKVSGNEFECSVETKTPMGPIKVVLKGRVDGDELTGEATTPFGPAPITGKREGA